MTKTIRKKTIGLGQHSLFDVSKLRNISPYAGCPFDFMSKALDNSLEPNLIVGDCIFGIALPKPWRPNWGYVHVLADFHDRYLTRYIFPVKGKENAIELRSQKLHQFPIIIRKFTHFKMIYRVGPMIRNL